MFTIQLGRRKKVLTMVSFCLIVVCTLIRTNMVSFADAGSGASQKPLPEAEELICPQKGAPVFKVSNNGGREVVQSGSFQAADGQKLIIEVAADLTGGNVDLFLFSPSGKEERLTFGSSDITKTIELSEGTWAYNATGFFESGNITINGTTESSQ